MIEFEIFGIYDLGHVFSLIYNYQLCSYSRGCSSMRIYLHSELAYAFIVKWMPGWVRKAGPSGVWKNSQGIIFKIF